MSDKLIWEHDGKRYLIYTKVWVNTNAEHEVFVGAPWPANCVACFFQPLDETCDDALSKFKGWLSSRKKMLEDAIWSANLSDSTDHMRSQIEILEEVGGGRQVKEDALVSAIRELTESVRESTLVSAELVMMENDKQNYCDYAEFSRSVVQRNRKSMKSKTKKVSKS